MRMNNMSTINSVTRNCMLQKYITAPQPEVDAALRLGAEYYHGKKGLWAYDVFDEINAKYFGGLLPTPMIQWALTPHGHCLGLTHSGGPPLVTLHPSIMNPSGENPWGITHSWLGPRYAWDVLIHELIHVSQRYLHDGGTGPTSHNNTVWVGELNRLIPLLGFPDLTAGMSRIVRVPIPGLFTKRGKPKTRPVRQSDGDLPHSVVARFPSALRTHLGTAEGHYCNRQ